MLIAILKNGFQLGPLLFGLLFIPPVTAQMLTALHWTPPFGLAPLTAGFILGGIWGFYAQWRGTWLTWRP